MTDKIQTSPISHVADTAFWIAAYRAQESKRSDAVFKDPLAEQLAGERGQEIAASIPHTEIMAYAMIVRTTAIDRLIQTAIACGIDSVINLGAGLDTRPYRMQLPARLRWYEVDLPAVIDYKDAELKGHRPVCPVQRISADLSNEQERADVFARLSGQCGKALVITEGVIGYLTNEQASALSREMFVIPAFAYWIQDYSQGPMRRNRHTRKLGKHLKMAPMLFSVDDPIGYFQKDGWKIRQQIFFLDEATRINRPFPSMFPWSLLLRLFPKRMKELGNKTYGYVLFGKTG